MDKRRDITGLLQEWSLGNQDALNKLIPLVYSELHRLASQYLRRERAGHTLQPTALVHEAYLKLLGRENPGLQNRAHFIAVCAQVMRRILVDYARVHSASKRKSTATFVVDQELDWSRDRKLDVIKLDEALTELGDLDPDLARLVELKFFGGLTNDETAAVMGTSLTTVKREWASAKAVLYRRFSPKRPAL
jgi:RNA polymerase sigma factor (TIGR02999 family)